jgi:hypothetical protein
MARKSSLPNALIRPPTPMYRRALLAVLPVIPALALTLAIPLVNQVQPRVLGLPFLLAWIAGWVLLTPFFLWTVYRGQKR